MQTTCKKLVISLLTTSLFACAATQDNQTSTSVSPYTNVAPVVATAQPTTSAPTSADDGVITLEQAMADPDWIGRQPESAWWGLDGKSVFYTRKREGSVVRDTWQRPLSGNDNGTRVGLNQLDQASVDGAISDASHAFTAWEFEGNLFARNNATGKVMQLTRDNQQPSQLQFLTDGRLSYRASSGFYAIDVTTGRSEMLVSWLFDDAPKGVKPAEDMLAEEQQKLIQVIAKRRADRQARFDYQQTLQSQNASMTAAPFYLPDHHELVDARLSPDGRYVLLAEQESQSFRKDTDIMPNYVTDDGRIDPVKARQRVHDAKPFSQYLWLLDIKQGAQHALSYNNLPGINDDVLASVKAENAKAKGETYTPNRLPRDIQLLEDWYWSQSAIQWHSDGKQVAIMLEAWDNKDRWLVTVDLTKNKLVTQHRLHDDAWVNYDFNSFGWMHNSETLYYLSEQTGYSQLYIKPLKGKEKALTSGEYEVNGLTLTKDDSQFYFKGNKKHPGIYEIYRVTTADGKLEQLTDLNGMTDYQLSPDESKLLLTHSKTTLPPELYVQDAKAGAEVSRLTNTVSDKFKALPWTAPQVVKVPSSHTKQPIFAKVYLPADYQQGDARRAVIFNHGAGYLQNSDLGWSGYFREFMFHNMLAQQGYVVMDMDYRASKGYGRDWRTAIYRHMGKPEIEDLADGVNWLVDNANVDRKRVGTYGGSYGGFMTFMALFTAPDLFQAGAALRPVSDWAHYNHGYTSNILNMPQVDPIAYRRSSPIYFAEGLKKPLLINSPMVDSNVFFEDSVRLVQRLIELGKTDYFETAIFPMENHGFVEPSSWLDEYRRIYKLFEQNL